MNTARSTPCWNGFAVLSTKWPPLAEAHYSLLSLHKPAPLQMLPQKGKTALMKNIRQAKCPCESFQGYKAQRMIVQRESNTYLLEFHWTIWNRSQSITPQTKIVKFLLRVQITQLLKEITDGQAPYLELLCHLCPVTVT